MRLRFSMRWMHLWETDGMKVMPLLFVIKYGWHYFNASMGMLRLLRSELFLYSLKGFRLKNACLCLRTHVHRYNEHRILPYKIHSNPHRCRVWTIPREFPEYPVIYEGGQMNER